MTLPFLGHGVGLRVPHYQRALEGALEVDWVEVITENFLGGGGRPRVVLEAVRRERPIVFHGVSLGVGSLDPPAPGYLSRLRALARDFEPAWISDHACWTRLDGRESHELLPLPFTEEALSVAVDNTQRAQDALGRVLVLENASTYVRYAASQLSEWEFLSELCRRSGCALLLDLNNVVVSAYNHGFSPEDYLAGLPEGSVVQFHLANHSQHARHRFDDHRGPVPAPVWALYESALRRFGAVSSLVEWDEDLPAWERLVAERDEAERRARRVLAAGAPQDGRGLPGASSGGQRAASSATAGACAGTPGSLPSRAPARGMAPVRARVEASPGAFEDFRAMQRLFFAALTWPRGVEDLAARDATARLELERTFAAASDAERTERLELYANAYFYRQLDALRETFPRLARLAGDVAFHDFVTDYVLERPSNDPDLHRRGDRLPAFVRAHALGRELPLAADLAELELALARAIDAPDAGALGRAELQRLLPEDWPALELGLGPSVQLVRSAYDLGLVVRLCEGGELERARAVAPLLAAPGELAAGGPARSPRGPSAVVPPEACRVLVFRQGHRALFRTLAPLEALALEALALEEPALEEPALEGPPLEGPAPDRVTGSLRFDALCEHLAAHGIEPATLLGWLERWLEEGLLRAPPAPR